MKSKNGIRPVVNIADNAAIDLLFDVLDDEALQLLSLEELKAVNKRLDAHFGESTVVPDLKATIRHVSSDRCKPKVTEISNMFELVNTIKDAPILKLIGVGGGGNNAVQHMVQSGIEGVEFICANTDAQALEGLTAKTVLHIGQSITKGLGAGTNPEVGRMAAMEDYKRIEALIEGSDMLFMTAGMGGGTGTGALPVVAQIARELGVLTVAVVTKPFPFEGQKRMHVAQQGINELRAHVDSLITIPNEKLLAVLGKDITLLDAFNAANDILRGAVQDIAELITNPGLINVDFADVRTVISEMGPAMMGSGIGRGHERAIKAVEMAISSPLLEDINLAGARGILVNITCGLDMAIGEFDEVGNIVRQFAADDATVVVGTVIDEALDDELRVTVVATGIGQQTMAISHKKATGTNGMHVIGGGQMLAAAGRVSWAPPSDDCQTSVSDLQHSTPAGNGKNNDMNLLDIPTFLRRQAD